MTRPELNTIIDTTITNKTAPNSITPQNEGDALKAVADYVDQEIASVSLPYKEFSGRIIQGSISSPINLTVIKNDFSTIPVVANDFGSATTFSVSLLNQFVFAKTIVKANPERNNVIISYPSNDNTTVYFDSFDFSENPEAPISFTFEIKVYN